MAPAMNTNMLAHPAVQQNLAALKARGVSFVEPGEGYLACGWIGKGRLAEPEAVVDAAERLLSPRSLALRPADCRDGGSDATKSLDPVRFIGNRSSGKMGIAIAGELAARGAEVTLITGPTAVVAAAGRPTVVRVRTAAEMHRAVMRSHRRRRRARDGGGRRELHAGDGRRPEDRARRLDRQPDGSSRRRTSLRSVASRRRREGRRRPLLVGFAAETADVLARAQEPSACARAST